MMILHRINLLSIEVGGFGLGRVNHFHGAGQHVLVNEQEISIFACADAASVVLYEHLLGNVDGQGYKSFGSRLVACTWKSAYSRCKDTKFPGIVIN